MRKMRGECYSGEYCLEYSGNLFTKNLTYGIIPITALKCEQKVFFKFHPDTRLEFGWSAYSLGVLLS